MQSEKTEDIHKRLALFDTIRKKKPRVQILSNVGAGKQQEARQELFRIC